MRFSSNSNIDLEHIIKYRLFIWHDCFVHIQDESVVQLLLHIGQTDDKQDEQFLVWNADADQITSILLKKNVSVSIDNEQPDQVSDDDDFYLDEDDFTFDDDVEF